MISPFSQNVAYYARKLSPLEALKDWLPQVFEGIETFHSADIPKGTSWHSALIDVLRGCTVGVFCATPESLRSQRMLFEAGALAQHGESPTLFTYLYSIDKLSGPLGQFQATPCDREDSLASVKALAQAVGRVSDARAISKFMETRDSFETSSHTDDSTSSAARSPISGSRAAGGHMR